MMFSHAYALVPETFSLIRVVLIRQYLRSDKTEIVERGSGTDT